MSFAVYATCPGAHGNNAAYLLLTHPCSLCHLDHVPHLLAQPRREPLLSLPTFGAPERPVGDARGYLKPAVMCTLSSEIHKKDQRNEMKGAYHGIKES